GPQRRAWQAEQCQRNPLCGQRFGNHRLFLSCRRVTMRGERLTGITAPDIKEIVIIQSVTDIRPFWSRLSKEGRGSQQKSASELQVVLKGNLLEPKGDLTNSWFPRKI